MYPCSVARFVSTVLQVPLKDGYRAAGLECCPVCDAASTKPEFYPYCNLQHQRKGQGIGPHGAISINITCDECGQIRRRPLSHILREARKRDRQDGTGDYGVFCGRQCLGKWLGRNHGFGSRPRTAGEHQTRNAAVRQGQARRTPAERRESALKAWDTRRANMVPT